MVPPSVPPTRDPFERTTQNIKEVIYTAKALTVLEPWAWLWCCTGIKDIETRSWSTSFRGWLWVHAGMAPPHIAAVEEDAIRKALREHRMPVSGLPLGVMLGAVYIERVVACLQIPRAVRDREKPFGYFGYGRYGWIATRKRVLPKPLPMRGLQGLWDFDERGAEDKGLIPLAFLDPDHDAYDVRCCRDATTQTEGQGPRGGEGTALLDYGEGERPRAGESSLANGENKEPLRPFRFGSLLPPKKSP